MPAILAPIGAAIKWIFNVVIKFIMDRIFTWFILRVVYIIVIYLSSEFIIKLANSLAEKIRRGNAETLGIVSQLEDMVWRAYHWAGVAVDELFEWFTQKVTAVLDFAPDKINEWLEVIQWAAFIDGLLAEIVSSAAETIRNVVNAVIEPVLTIVNRLDARLRAIKTQIADIETVFNNQLAALFDNIIDTVNTATDAINQRLDGLFEDIANLYNTFDQAIVDIKQKVLAIQVILQGHNQQLAADHESMEIWLDNFDPAIAAEVKAQLATRFRPAPLEKFEQIDWESYRWVNTFRRADFLFAVELPTLDLTLDLTIPELDAAIADVESIRAALATVAEDAAERFIELFPLLLRGNLEDRIKGILILVLTKAFIDVRGEILQSIGFQRALFAENIVNKKEELRDKMEEFELKLIAIETKIVDALPKIIEPILKTAIDEITEAVQEAGEEAIVNIDQFIPCLEEAASIVEIFPTDIKANANPNNSDSEDFTIQDIYRILCNNFFRSERIALLVHLAQQDLQVETSDLQEFLNELWDAEINIPDPPAPGEQSP